MRLIGGDLGHSKRAEEGNEIMTGIDRLWMKRMSR